MPKMLALALSSHIRLMSVESNVQSQVLKHVLAPYLLTASGWATRTWHIPQSLQSFAIPAHIFNWHLFHKEMFISLCTCRDRSNLCRGEWRWGSVGEQGEGEKQLKTQRQSKKSRGRGQQSPCSTNTEEIPHWIKDTHTKRKAQRHKRIFRKWKGSLLQSNIPFCGF